MRKLFAKKENNKPEKNLISENCIGGRKFEQKYL